MKLFEKFVCEKLSLPNRVVMAPMTRSKSPDGSPGEDVCEYYRRRAAGGVGLILTEGVNLKDPSSAGYPDVPVMYGKALDGWKKVVEAVHKEGGKIAPQLWHVGAVRSPKFDPRNEIRPLSPSGINYINPESKNSIDEMSLEDVERTIEDFVEAAKNAKDVGFDAIELHGAHGYLIDQFFWGKANKRTDEYGGRNLSERTRFACEIVSRIRLALGDNFPIIFRFSNWKLMSYEQHLFQNSKELTELLLPLKVAGVDIFHASSRNFNHPEFEGSNLNLAGWTKKITNLPTISVGSVGLEKDFIESFNTETKKTSINYLHHRMEDEEFDLVAIGRSLIADPTWAKKVK